MKSLNWPAEMLTVVSELRPLQLLSYLTIFILFQPIDAKRDLKSACLTCQQITENFNKVTEYFLNISIGFFLKKAYLFLPAFAMNWLLLLNPSVHLKLSFTGLWKNSKTELWWRQHSLGGEKTLQIWDKVRWSSLVQVTLVYELVSKYLLAFSWKHNGSKI